MLQSLLNSQHNCVPLYFSFRYFFVAFFNFLFSRFIFSWSFRLIFITYFKDVVVVFGNRLHDNRQKQKFELDASLPQVKRPSSELHHLVNCCCDNTDDKNIVNKFSERTLVA